MRLHSIRLKNIKSYGEGPTRTGVVVPFEPGINRIAGRNGHGKSTLIEALGYALFLADPVFAENFQISTYLLRAGSKAGEIEVDFEHDDQAFRVVRHLGTRPTSRDKILSLPDLSLVADGRLETDALLHRLFRLPEPGRLPELFSKLIGVKQGRLTWPFDAKPSEARRHFEPLLDVEVFRQCFDHLKPVADSFATLTLQHDTALAGVQQRVRDRADSPAELARLEADESQLTTTLSIHRLALKDALNHCATLEQRESNFRAAESDRAVAAQSLALADQNQASAREALAESDRAASQLADNQADHLAFAAAESELTRLQAQQRVKDAAERERQRLAQLHVATRTRASSDRQQAASFAELQRTREAELHSIRSGIEARKNDLERTAAGHDLQRAALAQALDARQTLARWSAELREFTDRQRAALGPWLADCDEVLAWDPAHAANARSAETRIAERLQELERAQAAAQEARRTLAEQLRDIDGGLCPFLKERCRQFDPARVQADLGERDATLRQLCLDVGEARTRHQSARSHADGITQREARIAQLRHTLEARAQEIRRACQRLATAGLDAHRAAIASVLPQAGEALPPHALAALESATFPPSPSTTSWQPPLDARRLIDALEAALAHIETYHERIREPLHLATQSFAELDSQRTRGQQDLVNWNQRLRALSDEIQSLAQRQESLARAITQGDDAAAQLESRIRDIDAQLQPLAALSSDIEARLQTRQRHAPGHQRYLAAQSLAELQPRRRDALQSAVAARDAAAAHAARAASVLESARAAHDPGALTQTRAQVLDLTASCRANEARLESIQRSRDREALRVRELNEARSHETTLRLQRARYAAARELTDQARRLLRDAAPGVAQGMCDRIARQAQQIFSHIHGEATTLSWDADHYSLRIDPGERRFAMLSGGEQTKLALAMTLAMIQQLTRLRFCIFDEPTYGVDADSRHRLADAILELQSAVRFDQLLLVSHDEVFRDRIEHVVQLVKSARDGTRVETAGI